MLYTLNVNGLIGKFQEIQNLLVTDQPHLVCLTETKLSADVDDNLISIPGYSIVRRDRNNHGGGVAIYYKTDLKVTRTDFTELKQELVMLKLETRFVNILIGCLYRPPSAPTSFWELWINNWKRFWELSTLRPHSFSQETSMSTFLILSIHTTIIFTPFLQHTT